MPRQAAPELSNVTHRAEPTCSDCYFRSSGLCALQLEAPCPTFRHHALGALVVPRQPRLVPQPLGQVVARHLVAQGAAA